MKHIKPPNGIGEKCHLCKKIIKNDKWFYDWHYWHDNCKEADVKRQIDKYYLYLSG